MYTAQGYPLTPAVAFPALALFNLLRFPITMLPWYLMEFINGWVALGRMQRFMQVSLSALALNQIKISITKSKKRGKKSKNQHLP